MNTVLATPADTGVGCPDARPWRYALVGSGWALVTLGALGAGAWGCGEQDYLQIVSNRPPLHYNGALVFLVWGGAHLALAQGRLRAARALGAALVALGAAVLLVSVPGVGVRLDGWAFVPLRYAVPVGPAGVAPGTGAGGALAGLALLLAARRSPPPVAGLIGALVGAFLVLGVPAALLAPATAPLLGPSGVSVLGAAATWVAGLGLLGSWFRTGGPLAALGRSLPVVVGVVGMGLTFALGLALYAEQEERVQRQVQFEAVHLQRLVLERFPVEVNRVAALSEGWPDARAGAPLPESVRRDIDAYVGTTPGCMGVARVDGAGRVDWVEQTGPLPAALEQFGGGPALAEAVRAGQSAVVRPPRSYWREQRVLLIFAPHQVKGDRGGFVAVISVQQFCANILNTSVATGYAVTVSEDGEQVFTRFGAPPLAGDRWDQTLPVLSHGHLWALTVSPTPDTLARESLSMPRLALLIGLALTGLLALAVHLAQTARVRARALETEMRERRLAEQALRQSEEKYRTLIENLGQGVFLQDTGHRYVAANGPFCQSVGRPEGEVIGATDADLFAPDLAARCVEEVRAVLADGRGAESETETVVGDRRTWVRRVLTPVRDATGRVTGVLGICWDVTQQRQLEAHVNQAQKMDAIGQLAGGIAHDFNNLLTVILGNLEVMLGDMAPAHPDAPLAEAAQSAAQRAAALTQRLLVFSRRHHLDWRP
ncbi:MAG TPA: PAS domain-containing protein, partial [Gemmata sp.]